MSRLDGLFIGREGRLWPLLIPGAVPRSHQNAARADRRTMRGYTVSALGTTKYFEQPVAGDFTAWHTYTVEWRQRWVRMYVDGKVFFDSTRQAGVVPPTVPMHLYLQQLVGPGDDVPAPDAHTPDAVTMHVDWVRVYR